jgi:SAM-dependent methyltransferase
MSDESSGDDDARIRDQIAFYREQARQRPSVGDDPEVQQLMRSYWEDPDVQDLVRSHCPPSARGLELASGAGRWTGALLDVCERITAVDSSAEMHEINRSRHGDARIEYVVADLFEYLVVAARLARQWSPPSVKKSCRPSAR